VAWKHRHTLNQREGEEQPSWYPYFCTAAGVFAFFAAVYWYIQSFH